LVDSAMAVFQSYLIFVVVSLFLVTGAFSGSFDRKSRLCLNDGQTRQTSAEMLGGIFFSRRQRLFLA